MADKRAARAEAARLLAMFEAAGAVPVEPDILQPAEVLLDLYGEDIRARAYVTSDPSMGEHMLRPDFTVPVVQAHMQAGAGTARYAYAGEVFRRQEDDERGRPAEYIQAGVEFIGGSDPAADEAEVFALIAEALAPLGLRAAIGDIGLLRSAVMGLETTEARRAALLRHLWRPRRFRTLVDRFSGRRPVPPARVALLEQAMRDGAERLIARAGPAVGLRGADEIAARLATLIDDAAVPPLDPAQVGLLDDLLALRGTPDEVLERLRDLAVDMPALEPAAARVETRLAALEARGVALAALDFEASHGRTTLEYYDGFVFGFYAPGRPDLPPVASGGRYDALTRVLGNGRELPAVGGVIRPGLVLDLAEGGP